MRRGGGRALRTRELLPVIPYTGAREVACEMAGRRGLSFSLVTLFLLTVIAALLVSQVVMMLEVRKARQEVQMAREEVTAVRKEFGYLKPTSEDRIQIVRIEGHEEIGGTRYRMRIPPGHRLALHLSDVQDFPPAGYPKNPKPTKTMVMHSWRNGADVVLRWQVVSDPDGIPRVKVATDAEELFDYRLEGWQLVAFPNSGTGLHTHQNESFSPNEVVEFCGFSNDQTKRGVMLWMEPLRP